MGKYQYDGSRQTAHHVKASPSSGHSTACIFHTPAIKALTSDDINDRFDAVLFE
ncbi:hypothetical protein [Photobacterium sanguinicancri]|uniref:hypothetical protein n=1 Tax=Photobacterium sanguinicancri TaxID=875932 RepID=UPI003F5D6438